MKRSCIFGSLSEGNNFLSGAIHGMSQKVVPVIVCPSVLLRLLLQIMQRFSLCDFLLIGYIEGSEYLFFRLEVISEGFDCLHLFYDILLMIYYLLEGVYLFLELLNTDVLEVVVEMRICLNLPIFCPFYLHLPCLTLHTYLCLLYLRTQFHGLCFRQLIAFLVIHVLEDMVLILKLPCFCLLNFELLLNFRLISSKASHSPL